MLAHGLPPWLTVLEAVVAAGVGNVVLHCHNVSETTRVAWTKALGGSRHDVGGVDGAEAMTPKSWWQEDK